MSSSRAGKQAHWLELLGFLGLLGGCGSPPEPFSDCTTAEGDAFDLTGLAIASDVLTADVGYGGGCETHDFTLCWPEPAFAESEPVQATLEITHDAHGDSCEAYFEGPVSFDLTPLREAWIGAYGGTTGTILVHVGAFTADYSF